MAAKAVKSAVVPLKGDLDIFSVQAQAAALKQAMEIPGAVVLDMTDAGDVDLSGIQLLLSAAVGRAKGSLRIQGLPAPLADRMRDLGLQDFLTEVVP